MSNVGKINHGQMRYIGGIAKGKLSWGIHFNAMLDLGKGKQGKVNEANHTRSGQEMKGR